MLELDIEILFLSGITSVGGIEIKGKRLALNLHPQKEVYYWWWACNVFCMILYEGASSAQ